MVKNTSRTGTAYTPIVSLELERLICRIVRPCLTTEEQRGQHTESRVTVGRDLEP